MRKENRINPTITLEASHLCLIGTISMGHSDNPNDSLGLFLTGYRDYPNDSLRLFERSKGIIRMPGPRARVSN